MRNFRKHFNILGVKKKNIQEGTQSNEKNYDSRCLFGLVCKHSWICAIFCLQI